MASRIAPPQRSLPPLPPAGFRKAVPLRVRYQVLIRQRGLDPEDGGPLDPIRQGIEFDHRPPLHARIWDEEAEDTIPPANDPNHIFARRRLTHRAVSAGDLRIEAKVRRLRQAEEEGEARLWRRRLAGHQRGGSRSVPPATATVGLPRLPSTTR